MEQPLIMTPGPTFICEEVRNAMARPITNPDLDMAFLEYYHDTCTAFQKLFHTNNDILILGGEGILGLEAACASLIEPGDRVLCIDNGIFGHYFADFARMYGADVSYFSCDYRQAVPIPELEAFLNENKGFKLATLVHCETPSGITNPVDRICPLLKKHGIISIVDAVSAIGGERALVDDWAMDIVITGSQKCLSASPGLTIMSVSADAWHKILNRAVPIAGFYCSLAIWKDWYQKRSFPYTQPISDIYGLRTAVDRLLADRQALERHAAIAAAVRKSLLQAGLELYALDGYANTVTAVQEPEGVAFADLFDAMLNRHDVMIAGSINILKGKVFRIGHMGENCRIDRVFLALKALDAVLRDLGVNLTCQIHDEFITRANRSGEVSSEPVAYTQADGK